MDKLHIEKLINSLLQGDYQNFPLLIQIVRQNLQNPECSDNLTMLFNNGFESLLEQILHDFLPASINLNDIMNSENIIKLLKTSNNKKELIDPKIKFLKIQKNRILFLDILVSMILIKKELVRELFLGRKQENQKFHLFKKLVIWQVITKEPRERHLLNRFLLCLFYNSLPEIILTNRTIPFGGNNRKSTFYFKY